RAGARRDQRRNARGTLRRPSRRQRGRQRPFMVVGSEGQPRSQLEVPFAARGKGIMNYEILEALGQIAREKNVGKELVLEPLDAGIVSAARRKYGPNADIRVKFDEKSATMEVQYVR